MRMRRPPLVALHEDVLQGLAARRHYVDGVVRMEPVVSAVARLAKLGGKSVRVAGRQKNRSRPRLDWAQHIARLAPGEFTRLYRLPLEVFNEVLEVIRPDLARNIEMGSIGSPEGAVSPELQLSMALRFFAGASYLDVALYHGGHRATFFSALWRVINAINGRDEFKLRFPGHDVAALEEISNGFQRRFDNPLSGCVGAVDGLVVKILRPGRDCPNSRSYFNRKGNFAYPLQAMCDSKYRFTFASCTCVGSTHDSVAFNTSSMGRFLAAGLLPEPFWIAADDAYTCSSSVLTPWSGRNLKPDEDAFNFWLSSSRIHIEQAFGILVQRFGILWRPIELHYRRVPQLVLALCKLHNICIDRKVAITTLISRDRHHALRATWDLQNDCAIQEELRRRRRDKQPSAKRRALTDELRRLGILRPRRSQN